MLNVETNSYELVEKMREIEEKLSKINSVQNTILEELAVLKSKMKVESREVRRIEYIIVSLIEELKLLESVNQINTSRISSLVDKYLDRERTSGEQ